ncbi:hypothetical protein [Celeribacter halophilus]|uniref:Uncharacterized protein n=1 Tax=Celeribacter halophilus TaxID=576117 RepID=A0A1I3S432_9RHOB|nr:hypothetical protein [Celeribacter halophilus]PZX11471.1 hypothetical protein LX82_01762 [Celeribacter halophilus]SFJ53554.1 hypothetical protein SAMN04488138_10640 [Celeribacter halophilus]
MAQAGSQQLNKRLTRIEARRRALRRGVIYSVNHDGLIIARPRRRGLRRPIHLVFVALAGIILFKAVLYATLGSSTYVARVEDLAAGTAIERAGAWVMQADQLTIWLALQGKMLLS